MKALVVALSIGALCVLPAVAQGETDKTLPATATPMIGNQLLSYKKDNLADIVCNPEWHKRMKAGDAYYELKQYSQAIAEYRQIPGGSFHLGDAYLKLHEYENAGIAFAEQGRGVDSGEAFYKAGSLAKAAAAYDLCWQSSHDWDHSQFRLYDSFNHNHARHADALYQTGQVEKSAREFHRVASAYRPQPSHKIVKLPAKAWDKFGSFCLMMNTQYVQVLNP